MQKTDEAISRPKVILLDVFGTLLDLSQVERRVNLLMDSRRAYVKWFDLFMQYCFVDNCTDQFHDFLSIGKATMQMTAQLFDKTVNDNEINDILELFKHLPLKEGAQEGLSLLTDHGFRIVALTNWPEKTVFERMERTGLISYFEMVLSAELVKKYKPCADVYHWAANKVGTAQQEILLVSTHHWDIAGAANAGMQTAYIEGEKQMLYPLAPNPTFTSGNLEKLANRLGS